MRGGMGNPNFRNQNQHPYQNRGAHMGGGFKPNQVNQPIQATTPQKPQESNQIKPAVQSPPAQGPGLAQQSNNKGPSPQQTASPAQPKIPSPPPQNTVKTPDLGSPQNQPRKNQPKGGMGNGQKPPVPVKKDPEQTPPPLQLQPITKSEHETQPQVKLLHTWGKVYNSVVFSENVRDLIKLDFLKIIIFNA